MSETPLILIVEGEPTIRTLLYTFLEKAGFGLLVAGERALGAEILRATRPALLIANVNLPDGSGEGLVKLARFMGVPVLLINGNVPAIEPFRPNTLMREIERLLSQPHKGIVQPQKKHGARPRQGGVRGGR